MTKRLILVLGDQVSHGLAALREANKSVDTILLAEVKEEATYVKHHKKKIVFLFSAMRHFANELSEQGYKVRYIDYEHINNQGSLEKQLAFELTQDSYSQIVVTQCGEYRLHHNMLTWADSLGMPVTILEDDRFLASIKDFADWAKGKKQLRMEFFYREMRRKTGLLIDDNQQPEGGKWNYDSSNRSALPNTEHVPATNRFVADAITQEVINLVERHFSDHFGDIQPFSYAVTRQQALTVLDTFIRERLPNFGQYQDAMAQGQPWLFHSHISFYLNCGLLTPLEVMVAVEQAYRDGLAPLNSVEGFIRQVLGWREYVRGFYWYFMPQLSTANFLDAQRQLPEFYWSGQTNMNCLRQCISETKQNAYAHHIQRLMVIGNFSLLTGLSPEAVNEWYLIVYADAYEWVEMPNVSGMVLYADGGNLASKPYAASGAYINKMSNYCKQCGYKVTRKTGEKACPFNYLYWHFIAKHAELFTNNPRMNMVLNTYQKMAEDKKQAIADSAIIFLQKLDNAQEV